MFESDSGTFTYEVIRQRPTKPTDFRPLLRRLFVLCLKISGVYQTVATEIERLYNVYKK